MDLHKSNEKDRFFEKEKRRTDAVRSRSKASRSALRIIDETLKINQGAVF